MNRVIALLKHVRAVEWALFAFTLFCIFRGGTWPALDPLSPGGRSGIVAATFLLVTTAFNLRRFRELTWSDSASTARRVFVIAAGLAAIPVLFCVLMAVQSIRGSELSQLNAAEWLLFLNNQFTLFGLMCPSILLACFFGIELKTHDEFEALRFLKRMTRDSLLALREGLPLVGCLVMYTVLDSVLGPPTRHFDAQMHAADLAILGVDPHVALEPLIRPWLSEWLAFAYTFYAAMFPLVIGAVFWRAGVAGLRETSFTLGLALLISYIGYALVPVSGPLLHQQFATDLNLYILKTVKEALMDATRITWDCFPSMHTGATVILSALAFRHARGVFWVTLPMVLSIPFACVYLRYHYVVDVLAGLALAGVMLAAATVVRRDPLAFKG